MKPHIREIVSVQTEHLYDNEFMTVIKLRSGRIIEVGHEDSYFDVAEWPLYSAPPKCSGYPTTQ